MIRRLSERLYAWADQTEHKPLMLTGPRHVGKSWLVQELAQKKYDDLIVLDFEKQPALASLFSPEYSPHKMLENIQVYLGRKVKWHHTLLFLDEVQATPGILEIIPALGKGTPFCHLIAAGSALGTLSGQKRYDTESGIQYMTLYPVTFNEFLTATGEDLLAQRLSVIGPQEPFPEIIHEKLLGLLAQYIFLGGLPEVIVIFMETGDFNQARKKQLEILTSIKKDFAIYGGHALRRRLGEVWRTLPEQLNSENKKFRFNRLRMQGRSVTYVPTVAWMEDNGLIRKIKKMNVPRLMLREYEASTQFRIYPFDTGLLGAQYGLTTEPASHPDMLFSQFQDTLIETFVAAELTAAGFSDLFYWSSPSDAEIDFLVLQNNHIYPVEVKSNTTRRNHNLRSYDQRFHPTKMFTITPGNFSQMGHFTNLPLYAIATLAHF